jgi:putative methionine-R-sulfoxide reductase with GAF domain
VIINLQYGAAVCEEFFVVASQARFASHFAADSTARSDMLIQLRQRSLTIGILTDAGSPVLEA